MRKSILLSLAMLALAAGPANAADVRVINCSADTLTVRSYDQTDILRLVANQTITVNGQTEGTISCVGASFCQLEVGYGNVMRSVHVGSISLSVRKHVSSSGAVIVDLPNNC